MAYLNTHSRTSSASKNATQQGVGRTPTMFGVFVGFVKEVADVQRNGRMLVWIPEFGSAPETRDGWTMVNYCSPFAGATNEDTTSKTDVHSFEGTQTSYGMWMVPPDINNQVLVMFINGDPSRGIWIGSLYNQFMNNMVPGMAASALNYDYPGKVVPVAEYNKWDPKVTQPDRVLKPVETTKFKGVGNQGLINDKRRGVTDSSARRESPSKVFGILTPGPAIKDTKPEMIRRKGGSSFIMDDAETSEYIQLATKSGAQININETNGFIYLINRDGTAWVQMDKDGNVDIFGARDISMRAQRDFNIRADRNINIEAGQNIFMKAAKDTKEGTTTFTYNVNNTPNTANIPEWKHVGEGKGDGGNIVMQSLQNWHSTAHKGTFLKVIENDMNVQIGNSLNVQTLKGGQNYKAAQGIKQTTDAAFDIVATGNIRVNSAGTISVIGKQDIVMCTNANLGLNANGNIVAGAGGNIKVDATLIESGTSLKLDGNIDVTGAIKSTTLDATAIVSDTVSIHLEAIGGGGPVAPSAPAAFNTLVASPALSADRARPAEIKPLNDKINILATWKDPVSKFVRNSVNLQTTVSRFPTYEPCPEHQQFSLGTISKQPSVALEDNTYIGSAGPGNVTAAVPDASPQPGATNELIKGDPAADSSTTKDTNLGALLCQLKIHEGVEHKVYNDSRNLPTGGIGHLIRKDEAARFPLGTPVSESQLQTWFEQDVVSGSKIAEDLMGAAWGELSDVRKRAMIDLSFNLGKRGLSKFVNFITAMKAGDFNKAGAELHSSAWFKQVAKRGPNIISMIVNNTDATGCSKKFPG